MGGTSSAVLKDAEEFSDAVGPTVKNAALMQLPKGTRVVGAVPAGMTHVRGVMVELPDGTRIATKAVAKAIAKAASRTDVSLVVIPATGVTLAGMSYRQKTQSDDSSYVIYHNKWGGKLGSSCCVCIGDVNFAIVITPKGEMFVYPFTATLKALTFTDPKHMSIAGGDKKKLKSVLVRVREDRFTAIAYGKAYGKALAKAKVDGSNPQVPARLASRTEAAQLKGVKLVATVVVPDASVVSTSLVVSGK